jgi:hypothetical protein
MPRIISASILLCLALPLLGPDTASAQVSGALEQIARLEADELLRFASMATGEMRAAVQDLTRMASEAARQDNAAAQRCLADKLETVRLLLGAAAEAELNAQRALSEEDQARADHEIRKIAIALSRIRRLHAEAELCGSGSSAPYDEQVTPLSTFESPTDETEAPIIESDFGPTPPDTSPFR